MSTRSLFPLKKLSKTEIRLFAIFGLLVLGVISGSPELISSTQAQSTVNVTINNYAFAPQNITVVMGVNNTLTWTNMQSGIQHTVTADDGSWTSATLSTGQSFTHTFLSAGTFTYHCSLHTYMKGTVRVLASGSPSTSTSGSNGGGIPEFPFGILAVGAIALLVVGSYLLARQSTRLQRKAGLSS